jgi:AraC-like DNA-binding protein
MTTDPLADMLGSIRLSGAMFLRGDYSAPWALDSPESQDLSNLLAPGAERLILFHIIRHGRAWVRAKSTRVEVQAGDVVILPHADQHVMGSLPHAPKPIPIASLLPPAPWDGVPVCRFDGGGEETGVVCGYLKCDELIFNSFLMGLPPIFRIRPPAGPSAELFNACVNFALDEHKLARMGQVQMSSRIPEMLLIVALRIYTKSNQLESGWLVATSDRILRRALMAMHSELGEPWTVSSLAVAANTSQTVLAERFKSILGKTPARYLTELRMQRAADALSRTPDKIATIASSIGYGSEEAFSRAFKKHVGMAPAAWRLRKATASQMGAQA